MKRIHLAYAAVWLITYVATLGVLLLLYGCEGALPTQVPYPQLTERQQRIYDYTQCFAQAMGLGSIHVTFHEDLGEAAGMAWPDRSAVKYHVASVENGEDWYLQAVAAHEVCHISGIWDEKATDACALLWIAKGVCP